MQGLIAHKDTVRVSEEKVRSITAPEFTKSWHPFAHGKVLDAVTEAATAIGHEIEKKEFSLTADGQNMFAVMQLKSRPEMIEIPDLISKDMLTDSGWCVGVRNSVSKRFALGLCAGTTVFVCDNLAFNGEFVEFRKHTGGLGWEELITVAKRAVYRVVRKIQMAQAWQQSLQTIKLEPMSLPFKAMTFDLVNRNIIPVTSLPKFVGAYETENKEGIAPGTVYAFHGAITRMLRDANLFGISKTTSQVQPYMDEAIRMYFDAEFGGFASIKERFPKEVNVNGVDKFLYKNGNGDVDKDRETEKSNPEIPIATMSVSEVVERLSTFQRAMKKVFGG